MRLELGLDDATLVQTGGIVKVLRQRTRAGDPSSTFLSARNLPDHNSRMWIWWRFCNIPYYDLGMNSVVVGKKIRWLDQNVRHCGCDLWSRVVPVTLTRIGQSANSGEHSICLGHRTHILLAETTLQYSCKDTQPVSYRCAKNRRITCGKYATHSRL